MATPLPASAVTQDTFPLMSKPYIAFLLAVLAGVMSGYTFFIDRLFATVQSGNVIQVGFWLFGNDGDGNETKWYHAASSVLAFGIGAASMVFVGYFIGKIGPDYSWPVLLIESVILIVFGFSAVNGRFEPWVICLVISFVAGMQGQAFHKINGMLYGNVAVTLVVQLAFAYLAAGIIKKPDINFKKSWDYFLVLIGFSTGGLIGAFGTREWDEKVLWLAAALAIILAIFGMMAEKDDEAVDIAPITASS